MFLKVGPKISHYLYSIMRPVGPPHCFDHSGSSYAEVLPFNVAVFDDSLVDDVGIREVEPSGRQSKVRVSLLVEL